MAVGSNGAGRLSPGLPPHLVPREAARSFVGAAHVAAAVCLVAAMAIGGAFQLASPSLALWPAVFVPVPMLVVLHVLGRTPTPSISVCYLLVGGASVYWYSLTVASQIDIGGSVEAITLALPKIALILVGGGGAGALAALRWTTLGALVAELAAWAAIAQIPDQQTLDGISIAAYVVLAMVLGRSWMWERGARRMHPVLHRAAREELVAGLRHRMELRAAALLHDTVLNHMSVVAQSPPGGLSPLAREQIGRDLALLENEEWWTEPRGAEVRSDNDWRDTDLYRAVREVRLMGLDVAATGDTTALLRLEGEESYQLALAVRQCLVNVLAHSGASHAEVVVYGADTDVLVMVVDTGCGFDPEGIGPDRLGLKSSVRQRIEAVGGTVRVWSTTGRGTSILIRLPVGPPSFTGPIAAASTR